MGRITLILTTIFIVSNVFIVIASDSASKTNGLSTEQEPALVNNLEETTLLRETRSTEKKKKKRSKPAKAGKKGRNNKKRRQSRKKVSAKKHKIRTNSKKGGSGNSIIQKTKKNNLKKRGKGKNSKRKTKKSKNNLKKKKGKNIKRRKKMSNKNLEKNKGKINKQKAKKSKVKKNKKSNLKKQGRKNKKKTSKNSKGARNGGDKKTSRQTSCTNDCVIGLAKLGGIFGNQARNFFRQASRALIKAKQKSSKGKKKDDFEVAYVLVLKAAGGDPENPKCKGAATSGNDSIKGTVDNLKNCSNAIGEKCVKELTDEQQTTIQKCYDTTKDFRDEFSSLFVTGTKTVEQICDGIDSEKITKLKADMDTFCANITEDEAKQNYEKRLCDQAFQSCRKAERNAASQVDKCREEPQGCTTTTPAVTGNTTASGVTAANGTTVAINGTTSNGTTANGTTIATSTTPATIEGNLTQTEAVAELATANKIKGALDKTEEAFGNALNASGKAKGPGDDGKVIHT